MGTKSKACLRCKQEHDEPSLAYVETGADRCIAELSRRVEELEARINAIGRVAHDAALWTTKF